MVKKLITTSLLALLLLGGVCILASDEEVITGLVMAKMLNISVEDGVVDWGTLELGAIADTITLPDHQVIYNAGNIPVEIGIKVDDTENWNYVPDEIPTIDEFGYKFTFNSGGSWFAFPEDHSYHYAGVELAYNESIGFDLKLFMPTGISNGANQQSILTTILATAI